MTIKEVAKQFLETVKKGRSSVDEKPAIKMLDKSEIEDLIREQAYKLYKKRGGVGGSAEEDWAQAERMVTKV
jgi:hypothetical protein